MKLIRCPYCGAEFTKHHIEYVGADPQMQIVAGLFFISFAVNAILVHRYFEEWFPLLMSVQLIFGAGIAVRGAYKFLRGRWNFVRDVKRHLYGHHTTHRVHSHRHERGKSESPLQTMDSPGDETEGRPSSAPVR